MAIYGHDVIPEGYESIGDEQMVVSTSFGLFDSNKVYLSLDLAARYRAVHDLRVGQEILPLYPDKAPARLRRLPAVLRGADPASPDLEFRGLRPYSPDGQACYSAPASL